MFLGERVVTTAEGTKNPFFLIGQASLFLFLIIIVDAAITIFRRRDRDKMVLGVGLVLFILIGSASSVSYVWSLVNWPIMLSLVFLPMILAMSFEISHQLHKTKELSEGLQQKGEWVDLAAESARAGFWAWDYKTGKISATGRPAVFTACRKINKSLRRLFMISFTRMMWNGSKMW